MNRGDIRVAMIGARGHHTLASGFGKVEGMCLVAAASDGCDDAAKGILKRPYASSDVNYYDHFEEMLDTVKPEVVSVGAVSACAAPPVIAALQRGIHVVCDKPIVNTFEELDTIRHLTAENPSLHVITEFPIRLYPAFAAARDAVQSGEIGEPILVTAQKSYKFGAARPDFYKTRKGFAGTVIHVGSHMIDMAYFVTGLEYASVQGIQGNLSKREYPATEDHAAVLFRMANGACTVVHMDYLRPATAPTHGDDRIRVAGNRGVVEVRDGQCLLMTATQPSRILAEGIGNSADFAREVIRLLRGDGKCVFSTAQSLYIADVLLKTREATDNGRTVNIKD